MEESAEAERGRSFLSKLFRTDCYNMALRQLSIERCKDLGSEQRTRLVHPRARSLCTACQQSLCFEATSCQCIQTAESV